MEPIEEEPSSSSPLSTLSATERRYIALQREFLEYKGRVEAELLATAREQAALHSRLIEQAVDLAEAKALIDDLQQQLFFYESSARTAPSDLTGNGTGFWDFLFGTPSSPSVSPQASPAPVDDSTIREYERRFADWQRIALARIAKEEKTLKMKIARAPEGGMHPEESVGEDIGGGEFDDVFDADWNADAALPSNSPRSQHRQPHEE